MTMTYKWKADRQFKVSAQVAGEIISALAEEYNGLVTADVLVDTAEPVESPLHEDFEWDNQVAGQAWREETARRILRSVVVVNEPTAEHSAPLPVRAFVNVTTTEGRGYTTFARVLSDTELWAQVISDILKDLQSYRIKLASFRQFSPDVETALHALEDLLVAAR